MTGRFHSPRSRRSCSECILVDIFAIVSTLNRSDASSLSSSSRPASGSRKGAFHGCTIQLALIGLWHCRSQTNDDLVSCHVLRTRIGRDCVGFNHGDNSKERRVALKNDC